MKNQKKQKFPSPIGVNHYELYYDVIDEVRKTILFPSPIGVNHYE